MSRARSDALTDDLFSLIPSPVPQTPASMDFRAPVSHLVSQLLKASPESRNVIAARMSDLASVDTSKAILDSYTAETREECNIPLWKAPIIEIVTGSRVLSELHAGVLGGRVLWGDEVTDADVGRAERQIAELQEQLKALRKFQQQRASAR